MESKLEAGFPEENLIDRQGSILRLARLVVEKKAPIVATSVLAVISSFLALLLPWLTEGLVESMSGGHINASWIIFIAASVLLGGIVDSIKQYVVTRVSEHNALMLRSRVVSKVMSAPILDVAKMSRGDLIARITADVGKIQSVFSSGILDLAGTLTLLVGAIVMMALIDLAMLTIVMIILGLVCLALFYASARVESLTEQAQRSVGILCSSFENALNGIKTVKALRAESQAIEATVASAQEVKRTAIKIGKVVAVLAPLSRILVYVAFMTVLLFGAYRVSIGELSIGALVSFAMLVFIVAIPLSTLTSVLLALRTGAGALVRLEEVMSNVEEERDQNSDCDACASRNRITHGAETRERAPSIRFDNVSLTLDERKVLDNLSFFVPGGSAVALVGPSGCGKTSCLGILERFYTPNSGEVYIGKSALKNLSIDATRQLLRYQEQDSPVFPGTVRYNLEFGSHAVLDEKLWQVLDVVSLASEVKSRGGLDVDLKEHGMNVSGGERQRVALARVLLGRAPILLLDEATSQVDEATELKIIKHIRDSYPSTTILLVTHRLSVAKQMDNIVVFGNGGVVATGTHAQLMDCCPEYRTYLQI
ncbi:ABC transporter ATP-binding protein [Corynebacterium belfantii]|uniref:ABC transporter ATP-binding protein n=1 Tax=Corynebacterium belfantii TaxID=2014537 RepID=UPI00248B4B50|nr:ABC transporter ATP-binding protein [Corynebacterium belfantii]